MANTPTSPLTGLPIVNAADLKANDPASLNRIFRLLAQQLQQTQTDLAALKARVDKLSPP